MTVTGAGQMSIAIVVAQTFGSIMMGAISFIRPHRTHCPAQVKKCEDKNHVYYLNTSKCHPNGTSVNDLCGQNMVIYPVENCPIQGQCDCDYDKNGTYLVYHQETDQCYFIYSQGPCKPGLVVKMLENGTLSCEKKIEGESYSVDELIERHAASSIPSWPFGSSGGISHYVGRKCYPGSYQDVHRQCQRTYEFEFHYPDEISESDEEVDHSNRKLRTQILIYTRLIDNMLNGNDINAVSLV